MSYNRMQHNAGDRTLEKTMDVWIWQEPQDHELGWYSISMKEPRWFLDRWGVDAVWDEERPLRVCKSFLIGLLGGDSLIPGETTDRLRVQLNVADATFFSESGGA